MANLILTPAFLMLIHIQSCSHTFLKDLLSDTYRAPVNIKDHIYMYSENSEVFNFSDTEPQRSSPHLIWGDHFWRKSLSILHVLGRPCLVRTCRKNAHTFTALPPKICVLFERGVLQRFSFRIGTLLVPGILHAGWTVNTGQTCSVTQYRHISILAILITYIGISLITCTVAISTWQTADY